MVIWEIPGTSFPWPVCYVSASEHNCWKSENDATAVTFTRWLVDSWGEKWKKILFDTSSVNLGVDDNKVSWRFGLKDLFSVKSVYNALTVNENGRYHKKIWKGKIPEKLKIFLWMALNNAILTKDNMIKRKWPGSYLLFLFSTWDSWPSIITVQYCQGYLGYCGCMFWG